MGNGAIIRVVNVAGRLYWRDDVKEEFDDSSNHSVMTGVYTKACNCIKHVTASQLGIGKMVIVLKLTETTAWLF